MSHLVPFRQEMGLAAAPETWHLLDCWILKVATFSVRQPEARDTKQEPARGPSARSGLFAIWTLAKL